MFRSLTILFSALAFLSFTVPVAAQTVGTTPNASFAMGLNDVAPLVGQRIQAPGPNLRLESFTFYVARGTPTFGIVPVVHEVTSTVGGVTLSAPLWTGTPVAVSSTAPTAITFGISPSIPLDPAKTYVIALQQQAAGQYGHVNRANVDDYAPADGFTGAANPYNDLAADFAFQAVFGPVPAPVPTLTEWATILLGLLLAGVASLTIQRRRFVRTAP